MAPCQNKHLTSYLFIGILFTVSGCLPFSCQPGDPRALFPSDSLSRQMAESIAVDTLTTVWESRGGNDVQLSYPRTVRFSPQGTIYVSDGPNNQILEFLPEDGALESVLTSISYDDPFIVGIRQDTLLVFNPGAKRVDFTLDGETAFHTRLPDMDSTVDDFQYVTASGSHIYYKMLGGDEEEGRLFQLDHSGAIVRQASIPPPNWRHAGMMRMWGDSLISFSGFRPMIHIFNAQNSLDSLALAGFDSPMLARTRAYSMGQLRQPPLLYSSAAPLGDQLYVLNLRPGWLRIDVFDRKGNLVNRLVQEGPGFNKNFFPVDIDARHREDGFVELIVAYIEPEPQITLYTWQPEMQAP